MTHVAVFDVVVACSTFLNVDLFTSGSYAVRVRVVTSATKTSAVVVRALQAGRAGDRSNSAGVVDAFTYTSGAFDIRYAAQQVELNEGAVFRLELPIESVLLGIDDTLLQVQLAHGISQQSVGAENDPLYALKDVSTVTYRFASDLNTTSVEHLPVIFDEDHFGMVDMLVAKSFVGIRVERSPLPRVVSAGEKAGVVRSHSINKQARVTRRRWAKKGNAATREFLQLNAHAKTCQVLDALQTSLHTLMAHVARLREGAEEGKWPNLPEWADVQVEPPPSPFNEDGSLKPGLSYRSDNEAMMAVVGSYAEGIKTVWEQWISVLEAHGHHVMRLEQARWRNDVVAWWRTRVSVVHNSGEDRLHWKPPAIVGDSCRHNRVKLSSIPRTELPLGNSPPFQMLEITSPKKKGAQYEFLGFPNVEQEMCAVEGDDDHAAFKALSSSGTPFDYMRKDKYNTSPGATSRAKHLVVCVHGFGGNSFDVRQMANYLSMVCPRIILLHSATNESATTLPIETQGERLAKEITAFIGRQPYTFYRISFIAHSLGGVLVRAALTHESMAKWHPKMHTLVTLSSPHLGYLYNHNRATNVGVWLLCKVFRSLRSLRQLTLTDVRNRKDSYLYKLSEQKTFGHFSNVLLLSSSEDGFVPYHSARLEVFPKAKADAQKRPEYVQMANNVYSNLGDTRVIRLDVNFGFRGPRVERVFGRPAHILFLDNARFCQMFTHLYSDLFL